MPLREEFLSVAFYRPLLINTLRILLILIFAFAGTRMCARLVRSLREYVVKAMVRMNRRPQYEIEKRAQTVADILGKTISTAVWVTAFIMILKEMNFDVRPLLAGAGVVGVAVGFGAQTFVKDMLGGFFILLDGQIRIGDVVNINGTGGLVEAINLRTTLLRSEDGAVHVFPNGSIQKLSNQTVDFSYAVFSVAVRYSDDTDRAVELLREIGAELREEEPFRSTILTPLDVYGVDQLADSAVILKGRFKTQAMQQWSVSREMNRRIKKRFAQMGFAHPYPTHAVTLEPELRAELKQIVREVLEERERKG
jgi:small conductance mechanosensitive channel